MPEYREYTIKIHKQYLRRLLMEPNFHITDRCPAAYFNSAIIWTNNPCNICKKFVNVEDDCPCFELGCKEAILRSRKALDVSSKGDK